MSAKQPFATLENTRKMATGYLAYGDNILIHREIAEKSLGRPLKSTEVVHHVDYDKTNNTPSNLVICTEKYHKHLHVRTNAINAGVSIDTHSKCSLCKVYHLKEEFSTNPATKNGLSNNCKKSSNLYRKQRGYGRIINVLN